MGDVPSRIARGLFAAFACGVLLAVLVACGGEQGSSQDEGQGAAQQEEAGTDTDAEGTMGETTMMDTSAASEEMDWGAVAEAIGKEGELMDGGVYRVSFPRSDLSVTSQGVEIAPSLSLGSYAAFVPMGNGEAMVMGDLVLTEDELNPVILSLQENGLRQTAVHKHLLEQDPPIWWQHYEGMGDPVELAGAINEALSVTDTPMEASASEPGELEGLDTDRLDEILGLEGTNTGSTYNFSVGRAETVTMHGTQIPASAGVSTVMNFQPTGGGNAAINGDFVMTADEVDPVVEALREGGIEIVELHNHTLDEAPRLFYMHFWADDEAEELAQTLRAALDETDHAERDGG